MRTRLALLVPLLGLLALVPAPAPAQPPAPPARAAGLEAVPTDSFAFLTVNVGKLWDNPGFKPLREWFAAQKLGPTDDAFGVPAADVERVTLFQPAATVRTAPLVLVTTKKPYNEARVVKALVTARPDRPDRGRDRRGIGNVVRTSRGAFPLVLLVDDRSLLFLPETHDGEPVLAGYLGQILAKKADGPLADALADAGKHDLALALDARPLGGLFDAEDNRELTPFLALFKARTVTFAADFGKNATGVLKLTYANADDAKRAGPVLKEGAAELTAAMEKELARRKDDKDDTHLERHVLEAAVTVLKAAKVDTEGANVFAVADVPYQDAVAKLAAALPKSYSAAVTSTRGTNNLKQLALAMHNFASATDFTPGDVIPFGNTPLAMSWRVQILPYIEQDNLYKLLDMMKPWDDPVNLKVLEKVEMPKVFEIPGRPAPKGHTYFRIFSMPKNAKGKDRPWLVEGQRGPRFVDVTDGTANTFMIVEAGEAVPWYKPDVLAYDGVLPLPQLGDKGSDRFLVAFGDGSTRLLRRDKLDEKTLRALITIQGGEPVKLP